MKPILSLALNDLRLTINDKPAFFWLIIMPMAMMWFFAQINSGSTSDPKVTLSIVNEDQQWLSESFIDLLGLEETLNLNELEVEDWQAKEKKVRTLVIPKGFTEGVLAGEVQKLKLIKDKGSSESFGMAGEVSTWRVIAKTIGTLVELTESGELTANPEAAFKERLSRPVQIKLEMEVAGEGTPVPQGYGQSVPGTLTFIVLMMTLIYGAVFLTLEKQSGMLRRQISLPISRRELMAGKWLGRMFIALMQLVGLSIAAYLFFDVPPVKAPIALGIVILAYAAAVASISTWLGAILANAGQASIVGWLAAMAMAALGGCWWPAELMPEWLQTVGLLAPPAWAMNAFHSLITFGKGMEAIWVPTAVLIGFAVLFLLLAARSLRAEVTG